MSAFSICVPVKPPSGCIQGHGDRPPPPPTPLSQTHCMLEFIMSSTNRPIQQALFQKFVLHCPYFPCYIPSAVVIVIHCYSVRCIKWYTLSSSCRCLPPTPHPTHLTLYSGVLLSSSLLYSHLMQPHCGLTALLYIHINVVLKYSLITESSNRLPKYPNSYFECLNK